MTHRSSVFISSTALDLLEYRKAVEDVILSLGMYPIGMRNFTASERNALQICYDEIQKADYFIGIYAHRYGFVPDAKMMYTTADGRTLSGNGETGITHHEYQWALERNLPLLLFVISDTDEHGRPLPVPYAETHIDGEPNKTRLAQFKHLILSRHHVKQFRSPDNLGTLVSTALAQVAYNRRGLPLPQAETITRRADFLPYDVPENHIVRHEIIDELRPFLTGTLAPESANTRRMVALHGMGGVGKSVIAKALCKDPQIQAAFPDGILWAQLGTEKEISESDVRARLRDWVQALGGVLSDSAPSLDTLKAQLTELLKDRTCLLAIDDVWQKKHAEAFRVGGNRCRILMTTRDAVVAKMLGAKVVRIEPMDNSQAIELLKLWANGELDYTESALLEQIVTILGRLPLAIKLAGAQLQSTPPDRWVKNFNIEKLKSRRPEEVHDSLALTFGLSLEMLGDQERELYAALTIFKKDEPIREIAAKQLWAQMGNLHSDQTEEFLDDLAARALLDVVDRTFPRAATLHDLLREYITVKLGDLTSGHCALLNSYRALQTGDGWHTVPDDGYLYDHLAYHLEQANLIDELHETFTDLRYIAARLLKSGRPAVENDLLSLYETSGKPEYLALRLFIASNGEQLSKIKTVKDLVQTLYSYLRFGDELAPYHMRWQAYLPATRIESAQPLPVSSVAIYRRVRAKSKNEKHHNSSDYFDSVLAVELQDDYALYTTDKGAVVLWDISRDTLVRDFHGFIQFTDEKESSKSNFVTDCSLSLTAQSLLACSFLEDKLILWSTLNGEIIREFAHPDVCACALSGDARWFVSTSYDGVIHIWDTDSVSPRLTIQGKAETLDCCISADGQLFFTTSTEGNSVSIWDAATGSLLGALNHQAAVLCCDLNSDNTALAVGCSDGTLYYWSLESRRILWEQHVTDKPIIDCAITPDQQVAVVSRGGEFVVVSAQNGSLIITQIEDGYEYTSCAVDPRGRFVAIGISGQYERQLTIWQKSHLSAHSTASQNHNQWFRGVSIAPNAPHIALASTSRPYQLTVWDHVKQEVVFQSSTLSHRLNRARYSPDGTLIAISSEDGHIHIFETQSGKLRWDIRAHEESVRDVVFDSTGTRLYSSGRDFRVRVWSTETAAMIGEYHSTQAIEGIALSADGDLLAISTQWIKLSNRRGEHNIHLWHLPTNTAYNTFITGENYVQSVAFIPSGTRLLTGDNKGTIQEWDVNSGSALRTLGSHTSGVRNCRVHPQGTLAATSDSHDIFLWDLASGSRIAQFLSMDTLMTLDIDWAQSLIAVGGWQGLNLLKFQVETGS